MKTIDDYQIKVWKEQVKDYASKIRAEMLQKKLEMQIYMEEIKHYTDKIQDEIHLKMPEIPKFNIPELPIFEVPEPPKFEAPKSLETPLKFENWIEKIPHSDCLCQKEIWKGAVETAIEWLRLEREVLIRHKLESNANGVTGCITILERMID